VTLTARRATRGFEPLFNLTKPADDPVANFELTAGDTFNEGDMIVWSGGKLVPAAAGAVNVAGIMAANGYNDPVTGLSAAVPSASRTFGKVYANPFNVYRCTFTGHRDAAATSAGSTTTINDSGLTQAAGYWVGAMLYIYAGSGKGSTRTVSSSAVGSLTFATPLPIATDTTTNYILLGAATAANDAINVGTAGVNVSSQSAINAGGTVVGEAGPLVVVSIDPANLWMDVVIRKHNYARAS
jgi:hypothetical protein